MCWDFECQPLVWTLLNVKLYLVNCLITKVGTLGSYDVVQSVNLCLKAREG